MPARSSAISNFPEKKIKIARIDDIKRTFHTTPLTTFREQYRRGSVGTKSSNRERLIEEAASVKNCAGRLLGFLVALCRQGFDATLSPLDVISERLKLATGGKGEARTIRRELQTLEKLGWLHRSHIKTNTQIMTKRGLLTLQVIQVTFSAKLYALLDFECPVSDINLLRPKRPLRPRSEPRQKQMFGRSAFADGLTLDGKKEGLRLAPPSAVAQTSMGVELAPPSAVAQTSILKIEENSNEEKQQIPYQNPLSQCDSENQNEEPKQSKNTQTAVGSYSDFRNIFIKVLEAHFFSIDPKTAQRFTQIAANQTMLCYPAAFPRVDFDLIEWSVSPWHIQREKIKDYAGKIKKFCENEAKHTETTKKIFFQAKNTINVSYWDSVACIMVSGRMKLREIDPRIVQTWQNLFIEQ